MISVSSHNLDFITKSQGGLLSCEWRMISAQWATTIWKLEANSEGEFPSYEWRMISEDNKKGFLGHISAKYLDQNKAYNSGHY